MNKELVQKLVNCEISWTEFFCWKKQFVFNRICEYDGKAFEVEFFDSYGDMLDVVTTPAELLELVEGYQD